MKRWGLFSPLVVLVFLALALASAPASAQKITGDITGTVNDATGGALSGASVAAHCEATGLARSAVTDVAGGFRLAELPVCVYKVSVTMAGFKTTNRDVQVAVNNITKADFHLQIGQQSEEVTVEGAAPLVEFSDKLNNYVDRHRIDDLPLSGRDFNSLLGVTPGVQRAPGGGFLAVNISGQHRNSNNYMIDGIPNNDRYYGDSLLNQAGVVGVPASLVPMDAIAEFTVQQTPSAEFGVKGGAAINVVMKSGTNDFHGSAHMYYHNDFADATNFFSKSSGPAGCKQGTANPCGEKTPLTNKQFGGTLGGPVVKDKTFFFAYYEGQRLTTESPYIAFVPTPAQVASARARIAAAGLQTNSAGENLFRFYPTSASGQVSVSTPTLANSDSFSLKLDHHPNATNQIALRYFFGKSFQSAPATIGELVPPAPNPPDLFNSVLIPETKAQLLGATWTSNFSPTKILEVRVGYTRFENTITPNNKIDPKSLGFDTGPLDAQDFGVPYVSYFSSQPFGYIGGIGAYPITTAPTQNLDVSASFTSIQGKHTIKIGSNFQHGSTFSLRNRARTTLTVTGGTGDPVDSIVGMLLGRFDSATRSFGSTAREMRQDSLGAYVNDDWKLTPRFTLSLGLRYDVSGALGEKNNLGSNFFPDRGLVDLGKGINKLYDTQKNNFGPRVGFAWDVRGNGRTAVRAGYALTYDIPTFGDIAAPRTTWSGMRATTGAFTQINQGIFSVGLTGDTGVAPDSPSATCVDPKTGRGNYVCVTPGVPIFGTNPGGEPPFNVFSVVSPLPTPRYHLYHLTLQHELFKNNVVTLSYIGSRGRDLLTYRDLNAPPIGSDYTNPQPHRPFYAQYPTLKHIIQLVSDGSSWYDSAQVSYRQMNWKGINTQYNLTYAKCLDTVSVERGGRTNFVQKDNPYDQMNNKGPCSHDVRLNFNVGGTYAIPKLGGSRMGEGWEFATVFTAFSGRHFTPGLSSRDRSGQDTGTIRANCSATAIQYNPRDPSHYIANAKTVFSVPANGTVGTCGRNIVVGPGLAQWDLSLIKLTTLGGNAKLQLRWEVFNVLNRANFDGSSATYNVRSGSFGQPTATGDVNNGNPVIAQGGPRSMQFALKLLF
jgi:hypothetical protein